MNYELSQHCFDSLWEAEEHLSDRERPMEYMEALFTKYLLDQYLTERYALGRLHSTMEMNMKREEVTAT